MDNIADRALVFALAAHRAVGQRRKYTDECYTTHTQAVACTVASVTGDQQVIAAAHLHDVVEDTSITVEDVAQVFGQRVAGMVWSLTDVDSSFGNRATRKAADRARLELAPSEVQTIKLADLIDNTASIVKYDPKFAETYLHEKALLLKVLTRGDARLLALAQEVLRNAQQSLGEL